MVTYSTNELISSSEFAKKFGTYLAQIQDNTVEKLAILKNNKVEAVIISKDEYESMKEALKEVESKKILKSIQSGLDDMKSGKTKSIDKLWDELWIYNIQIIFLKEAKQLSKKFKLLKQDLQDLIQDITINKDFGVDLGSNLYKKRVKNSSIPTGKSGGFRVIIYYQVEDNIVLISIYSKTQKDNINDEEIEDILKNYLKK